MLDGAWIKLLIKNRESLFSNIDTDCLFRNKYSVNSLIQITIRFFKNLETKINGEHYFYHQRRSSLDYGDYNDMVYPNLVGKDVEYEYDPNGNLIKNSDNRISLTTYNLLNFPQTVAFSGQKLIGFLLYGRRKKDSKRYQLIR